MNTRALAAGLLWMPIPALAQDPTAHVSIAAVGDLMCHAALRRAARESTAADGGYAGLWTAVAADIAAADIAFGNLETPVAPEVPLPLSGEMFDCPAAYPDSLAAAGWDVVSLANNHGYDQGIEGVAATLRHVEAAGLRGVGAGATDEAARRPVLVAHDGVTIAFLARTDLLNLDPEGPATGPRVATVGPRCAADCGPWRDALVYSPDLATLLADVRAARAQADLVVLSLHWGVEFAIAPLASQERLAEALTDAGVDVLLGSHPHVLQPVVRRRTVDGRDAVIAWSLGNFVSGMAADWRPGTGSSSQGNSRDGAILHLEVEKDAAGTRVTSVRAVPTWTINEPTATVSGAPRIRVVPADARRERVLSMLGLAP
jgi:poly-gamma-glutamate synthesis protein (capsule biosynthesis protein)